MIKQRNYKHPDDYEKVSQFLISTYSSPGPHKNWMQPRWEYMIYHPFIDIPSLKNIGLWEKKDEIIGLVHHEHSMGHVYFEISPDHHYLKKEMLEYAETNLFRREKNRKKINIFINEKDKEFHQIARDKGFAETKGWAECMSQKDIPNPFPEILLPNGYKIISLQDNNDVDKLVGAIKSSCGRARSCILTGEIPISVRLKNTVHTVHDFWNGYITACG